MEVSKAEFESRQKVCDERFARDKERIVGIEQALTSLTTLVTTMAEIQKGAIKDTEDQETRLRAIESRGNRWFNKIVDIVLGAAIMYMLSKSFGF